MSATTVTSTIVTTVTSEVSRGFEWLSSGVVGGFVGGLMAWGAVVIENLLSNRRERKRRMSERVYEPLLLQTQLLAEKIQSGEKPDLTNLEKVRQDCLVRFRDERVQGVTSSIYLYARLHSHLYTAARENVKRIIREEIEALASDRQSDLDRWRSRGYEVRYSAFVGNSPIESVDLESCLLVGKTPSQFLAERHDYLTKQPSSEIHVIISPDKVDKAFADALSESALKKADRDETVQLTRHLADMISEEPDKLAKELKEFIE